MVGLVFMVVFILLNADDDICNADIIHSDVIIEKKVIIIPQI